MFNLLQVMQSTELLLIHNDVLPSGSISLVKKAENKSTNN